MAYEKQRHADKMDELEEEVMTLEERHEKAMDWLGEEEEKEKEKNKSEEEKLKDIGELKDKQHKASMEAIKAEGDKEKENHKEKMKGFNERLKALEKDKKESDRAHQDLMTQYDKEIDKIKDKIEKIKEGNDEVDKGPDAVARLADSYDSVLRQLDRAIDKQRELNALAAQKGNSKPNQNRFAGGPVSGGVKYTVNELGKEAFLSASGQLSMINAPAWGEWRAPGKGTVIPAHLTSQLDIPRGGIRLNQAAGASSVKAGASGNAGLISAISGLGRGDSISNNVTIQSANPNKTASDMLVELTKIRHRRYRR